MLQRENGKCAICEKKPSPKSTTVDHIIPLSKEGINDIVNFQLTCVQCNQNKKNDVLSVHNSLPPIFHKILLKW